MAKCQLKLENNHLGFFYSGQVLSGSVELMLKKPMSCKGLRLTISGSADCKWKDTSDKGKSEAMKGRENYLQNVAYLFGSEDSEPIEFDAGFHSFGFTNALPANLPSSYDSKHGKIVYKIEALFIRPWKLSLLKAKTNLKVVTNVDLNLDPALRMPFYTELSKRLRCWLITSKTMRIKAGIPYSGFIPGHQVKIIFDISNKSNLDIIKMTINLVQITKLTSQKPREKSKSYRNTILESSALGTSKRSNHQFDCDITIPTNLVPVKHSSIMNVSYEIEIIAKTSSLTHKNPKLKIPIEIGTIPLNFDRGSGLSRCSSIISRKPSFIRKIDL